jgi:hypothetical protein
MDRQDAREQFRGQGHFYNNLLIRTNQGPIRITSIPSVVSTVSGLIASHYVPNS